MAAAQREPNVVVFGGGSWGTTVASICARRGPTLQWVRSEETAKDIEENHRNSKYLGDEVELSPSLRATTDFSEAANTADVVVMEMAGALKTVYAIAVGMGYSLGIGENTRAMVIARALREMSKLGEAMGGHRDTFAGLAGMGDLIVTCTSQRSRNRHVGEQLGSGKTIDEIISSMNQVAEGVKAASVIMEFANEYGISRPIAREVDGVVNHGATVEDAYRGLAAEKPGHDVHGSGF